MWHFVIFSLQKWMTDPTLSPFCKYQATVVSGAFPFIIFDSDGKKYICCTDILIVGVIKSGAIASLCNIFSCQNFLLYCAHKNGEKKEQTLSITTNSFCFFFYYSCICVRISPKYHFLKTKLQINGKKNDQNRRGKLRLLCGADWPLWRLLFEWRL